MNDPTINSTITARAEAFPCPGCGGQLHYAPGTAALKCVYCGALEAIPPAATAIDELDFASHAAGKGDSASTTEVQAVNCTGCGAQISLPAHVTAGFCAFCTTPLVIGQSSLQRLLRPQGLLPFRVTAAEAQQSFQSWLSGRWLAPNALKRAARQEGSLQGVYIPYWTYDCDTETAYRGERGEDRWESYTDSAGKSQRRVVTDWYGASGSVGGRFDDVLAVASHSLPHDHAEGLEPWDLGNLIPYRAQYLSGFAAEAYQLSLPAGFDRAAERIRPAIEAAIRRDIGGDHQRIHDLQTSYDHITFKHILLPIWISAYRFEGKVFRFLVNARSGEVQGERPWSPWKIAGVVLVVLLVVLVIAMNQ